MKIKKQKIGIYGGKFDPLHIGHQICGEWTREWFELDKVLFVTSANPPHKKTGVLDAELRHEMVKAGVASNCYFEACDIELRREGPSYMLDTVKALMKQYSQDTEFYLLLSAEYLDPDNAWRIDKWHGADELLSLCQLLVFPRDAAGLLQIEKWAKDIPQARIQGLTCPTPAVSSSMIREMVNLGKSVWYMVTAEVWQLIRDRRHYLTPGQPLPARYYEQCPASSTSGKAKPRPVRNKTMTKQTAFDPFAAKRAAMIDEFYSRMFALGGFIGATDTYKRTMWHAVPEFALAPAAYHLTMRKGLAEEGAGD
ncbi:MAG: nicotinate (nicotinamide) nucleotide adenylyltransferase, partial [Candidatus Obscuribacterales bacterium]|nr:nicotinate (nicotinamide) nucleotide adenylyltransferase [Candidatus Obscuribacterales bacterium]